jgi:hypothetical protein
MDAITPNLFASVALLSWPVVSAFLFHSRPTLTATLWTILAGQLVLPVGVSFKIEMIPAFDKISIPNLCALVGYLIFKRGSLRLFSNFGLPEGIVCIYLLSPIVTSLLNGDAFHVGATIIPGVGLYDGLSNLLSQVIALIPFFLARSLVREADNEYEIVRVLAVAGLAYSILLLFEIRFSPQLHFWLYGYYPSDFIQQIRGDGEFRPMAFMGHGLLASFFAMTTLIASAVLWRINGKILNISAAGLTAYFGVVLYLCKSGAASLYGLLVMPLVRWTSPKFQVRIAIVLASIALCYPVLRIAELFPSTTIVSIAGAVSEDRASSLLFRFDQEKELLSHALERPWFGWGRFGRSRVYKVDWRGIGIDTNVTDGRWIITFGQFGLIGYLAEFILLAIPIFYVSWVLALSRYRIPGLFLSAMCLILAINMIDLLPNSSLLPLTWLLAGALMGRAEAILLDSKYRQHSLKSPKSFVWK